jgi:hypothetical protein
MAGGVIRQCLRINYKFTYVVIRLITVATAIKVVIVIRELISKLADIAGELFVGVVAFPILFGRFFAR